MTTAIIGYTGFVGKNLLVLENFDEFYNSSNLQDIRGKKFYKLYISCIPAEKWKANKFPEEDKANIDAICEVLSTVEAVTTIVISTIDVYADTSSNRNEFSNMDDENHAYGRNRFEFERFALRHFKNGCYILRLPALFGMGLKKNALYDLLNRKYDQVEKVSPRSKFQWYNLDWFNSPWCGNSFLNIIEHCISENIHVLNLVTEPIEMSEIFKLFDYTSTNTSEPIIYDTKSFHSETGYFRRKEYVLRSIKEFIQTYSMSRNNLRVSNICVNNMSQFQFGRILELYGIKQVQIAPTKLTSWEKLDELDLNTIYPGLQVTSLQSITYGIEGTIFNSPDVLLNHLSRVVNFASKFNIRTFVFGCPKNRMKNENDSIDTAIAFFRSLGEMCAPFDITVCVEPNSIEYTNFLNDISSVGDFVRLVDHPNIRMMVDIGHLNSEQASCYSQYADIIRNIDISRPGMRYLDSSSPIVHESLDNLREILSENNYSKTINLEMILGTCESLELRESLKTFISKFSESFR